MPIQRTFRRTIFYYFIAVFVIFTIAILLFQLNREKRSKTEILENTLENITEITHNYIEHYHLLASNNFHKADTLKYLIPQSSIRITIIRKDGKVLYDSFVKDYGSMENHFSRPEIQKALYSGYGSSIRRSNTTKQEFYYYARNYDDYFVRAAMLYNVEIANFLKGERFFIFFIVALFLLIWLLINFVTKRLSVSITKLKDFAVKAGKNEPVEAAENEFPDNELGEIGAQIVKIYKKLKKAKDDVALEKDRLFNHMNILNEGISFFSPEKEKMLANSHFIQYISIISNTSTITAEHIFEISEFRKINKFLDENLQKDVVFLDNELPQIEYTIHKNESYFKVLCIIFADKSFEILITDITRPEKRRLLKQQLTSKQFKLSYEKIYYTDINLH